MKLNMAAAIWHATFRRATGKLRFAVLTVGLAASAAGCAITTQYGQGDDHGTPVYFNAYAGPEDTIQTAREHCAKYGKVPVEKARAAGRVDFACVSPTQTRHIIQLVSIAEDELKALRGMPQIYAVHYEDVPILVDPPRNPRSAAVPSVADSTISTGGGLLPFLIGLVIDESARSKQELEAKQFPQLIQASEQRGAQLIRDQALANPIVAVKAHVLLALQEAGLRNIMDVAEPIARSIRDEQLKARFREGVIIEFGTREWILLTGTAPTINFVAYAKLRRLADGSSPWAAECHQSQQPLSTSSRQSEKKDAFGAALKARLRELAEECAIGLSTSLLQNEKIGPR